MRTRKRSFIVRLSDKEMEKLDREVKKSCLNRESYVRALIAGHRIHERPAKEILDIYRELNSIGNNLSQIARIANATEHISKTVIMSIDKKMGEIWLAIKSL